ncbi:MAG: DUF1700 domain-containing protein [Lachnospiraceae bacterium]|nr:DUF1700 domain-containing protein [Lachnospiraceae bacterium]
MNKNEYLKKLSKLLHMLKEDEIEDIMAEYEQHIDMKMAEGLSEEEAVAAFGTVEELASDILDAYHVKPDFTEKKKMEAFEKVQSGSKKVLKNAGEAGKGFWESLKEKTRKIVSACKSAMKKTASFVLKCILAPFLFIKGLFHKNQERKEAGMEQPVQKKKRKGLGHYFISFIKALFRLIRKVMYGFVLFVFGITGMGMILCLGFLVVLLVLGYPVTGITIGILGAAMTVNSVAYLAGSKWRRI